MKKNKELKDVKKISELLDAKYGKVGTPMREEFDEKSQAFVLSEMLKQARKQANMTQQELADKIGTKKTYISRVENGRTDIQLSTLFKIFEQGLGLKVSLSIG
jgi:DNA-binding XRE family transcriptional regulator